MRNKCGYPKYTIAFLILFFCLVGEAYPTSSDIEIITSDPGRAAVVGKNYTYSPNIAGSVTEEGEVTWYLVRGPEGLYIDSKNGKVFWLPKKEQIGDHYITIKIVIDDGDREIVENQWWTIIVHAASKDEEKGGCFLLSL